MLHLALTVMASVLAVLFTRWLRARVRDLAGRVDDNHAMAMTPKRNDDDDDDDDDDALSPKDVLADLHRSLMAPPRKIEFAFDAAVDDPTEDPAGPDVPPIGNIYIHPS